MEAPSPARLYAAAIGALLVVLGVVGFFYYASFGALDTYEEALGALQVNGWLNLFYVATGAVGVLVAGASSRGYALAMGTLYVVLAIVGWGSEGLNLVVGVLGLAAAAGTPRADRAKLKPRAKPARQRP
ncbi:MAG TPA: DUF4383 domain-containing protein [Solirubrobacterales bacterium]|jgi:hypothetical protein|nr:DUF4383 domain-containing protein [Solirubrobacterales bacterium]